MKSQTSKKGGLVNQKSLGKEIPILIPSITEARKTMSFPRRILLAVLALAATPAHADDDVSASDFTVSGFVEQVTDYRYRGVSQTDGDFAIQGQINVAHSSGFYANLWATNLEDSDVAGTTEWDAGIGWTGEIAPI